MGRKRFGSSHLTGRLLEYKSLLRQLRQQHNPRVGAAKEGPTASRLSEPRRVETAVGDFSDVLDAMKRYCGGVALCPLNDSLGDYCALKSYCYGRRYGVQFMEGLEKSPEIADMLRRRSYLD